MTSKRQRRRSRIRNMLASMDKEREAFESEIEAIRRRARSDVANARRYAGEEALDRVIKESFANGDRSLFSKGVRQALDDERYNIGMDFGKHAARELFNIDPAIQMRARITDSLIHQAALSMAVDTRAYPEAMVHRVRITIPPIDRVLEI